MCIVNNETLCYYNKIFVTIAIIVSFDCLLACLIDCFGPYYVVYVILGSSTSQLVNMFHSAVVVIYPEYFNFLADLCVVW